MFRVKLQQSNFIGSDLVKLNTAIKYFEEFVNSNYFMDFILHFSFKDSNGSTVNHFHMCVHSREKVYSIIRNGAEILNPQADGVADIQIELDTSWTRNVIGYTYPETMWQWIYAKFFRNWSAAEISGNIAHEYCHKLGFDHEYKWTHDREYSVPYAIGYACENYAKSAHTKSYFQRFKEYFAS